MAKKKAVKKSKKVGIADRVRTCFNKNMLPFWSIYGVNGEILCHSEAYSTQEACDKTALQIAAQLGVAYVQRRYES